MTSGRRELGDIVVWIVPELIFSQQYLDKVNETTRPYVDAAAAKAKEVIDKIEVRPSSAYRVMTCLLVSGAAVCRQCDFCLGRTRGSRGPLGRERGGADVDWKRIPRSSSG